VNATREVLDALATADVRVAKTLSAEEMLTLNSLKK